MPLDDLVQLIKDHEVGLWCKRAAWLIVVIDVVLVAFQLLGLLVHPDLATLPISVVTTILGAAASSLWQFFVLYALGAIVTHLVRS